MNKTFRKTRVAFFAGFIALVSLATGTAVSAAGSVTDTYQLDVMFPDTIGEYDAAKEPDFATVYDMVNNPEKYVATRSGWSAYIYSCVAEQDWEIISSYSTSDSVTPHPASRLKDEIIAKYGADVYNLAVANNAEFTYDPNTLIPARHLVNQKIYGPTGRYIIFSSHNKTTGNCTPGDIAYSYNNLDFYVSTTFDVAWNDADVPNGSSTGAAYWELQRPDQTQVSNLRANSSFTIPPGKHVATRDPYHSVNIGNQSRFQAGPINFAADASIMKNQTMMYAFGYEYTNKEIGWVCTGSGEERTCTYNSNPDWRAVDTFELFGSIPVKHRQQETFQGGNLDEILAKRWEVGRKDTWVNTAKTSKTFYEQLRRSTNNDVKLHYDLATQTYMPITPGDWIYEVELPSDSQLSAGFKPNIKEGSSGHFYPADIDTSLKEEYQK